MKKLLILLFIVSSVAASAQIKISQFPAYTGYCDTCYVPILKNGVNYKMRGKNLIVAVDSMYQTGEIIYYRMGGVWKQLSSSFRSQWGLITGDISLQNDLILRLNAKENVIPTGTYNDYIRGNKTIGNFATDLYALGDVRYAPIGSSITVDSFLFTTRARLYKVVDSIGGAKIGGMKFKFPLNYNSVNGEVTVNTFTPAYNANRLQGNYLDPSQPCAGCFIGYDSVNGVYRSMRPDSANFQNITRRIDSLGIYVRHPLMGSKGATVNVKDTEFIDPVKVMRWDAAADFAEHFSESVGVTHEELADSTNNIRIAINAALANYYTKTQSDARFYPLASNPANYLTTATADPLYVRSADVRSFTATDTTRWGAATAPAADNPFRIDSARVTGTVNKTITNYYHNGTTYSYGFIDLTAGNGGTVTGGTITWPGAIFNTPTTGTVSSGILNLAPTLATQTAGTFLGAPATVNGTPSFRGIGLSDISTAVRDIPFGGIDGRLTTSDSLYYNRASQNFILIGNQNGFQQFSTRNYSTGTNAFSGISYANDIALSGSVSIAGSGHSDSRFRNRSIINSQSGFSFFPYAVAGVNVPSYADYRFYRGLTGPSNGVGSGQPMVTFKMNGHVVIGDTTETEPNNPLAILQVHKIIADSIVYGAGTLGSGGSGGTSYTDANARAAISLTTIGTSGAATYNSATGVLNVPQYTGGGSGGPTYSTGGIYSAGNSYKIPPSVSGASDIELFNIGNVLGASDARLSLKTGIGKVQYAMASTINLNWNTSTNKWTQDNASYPSSWFEHGTEGLTLHSVPPGTSDIYSGVIHENFQVRAQGVEGTTGISTGQYNQSKVPLYMKYKSAAITDDTHPGQFGQLGTAGNTPFVWLHSEETKGTEFEFMRIENNASLATPGGLYFRKSRGTYNAKTASSSGDYGGLIVFSQYDGAAYQNTLRIGTKAEATATAGVAPQSFVVQGSTTNTAGIADIFTVKSNGTAIAAGALQGAGYIQAIAAKTAAYTITGTDYTIKADATTAAFSVTLPTAVGRSGQIYVIKKTDASANAVSLVTTSSQTIDGSASYSLSAQNKYVTVQSDNANWIVIGNN